MSEENNAKTQPVKTQLTETQPVKISRKPRVLMIIFLGIVVLMAFITSAGFGGYQGYQLAAQEQQELMITANAQALMDQYVLGVRNLEAGEYDLARQRFEFILASDPNFPGVADKLAMVVEVLYATATPTPLPPTPTLTPTPDLRPIEDLFTQAENRFASGDWTGTIDTLVSLRKNDIEYRVVEVDAMLFQSLRNRGIVKINNESNLEGGLYDLSLAEQYAPLDAEAATYHNVARLYMIGLGFWEVYPEQAIYYFQQVASAAPYLRDASGWTARERYRAVLIQYADKLASAEEWCEAEDYYEMALSIRSELSVDDKLVFASLKCSPPTPIPEPDTDTPVPSATATSTEVFIPTDTSPPPPSPQVTATPTTAVESPTATEAEPTATIPATTEAPEITPTVVTTEPPVPTDTPMVEVSPSPTSVPQPTETSPPPPTPETPEANPTQALITSVTPEAE